MSNLNRKLVNPRLTLAASNVAGVPSGQLVQVRGALAQQEGETRHLLHTGHVPYFLSERDSFRCIRAQRLDSASKRPVGLPLDIYHVHHARLMNYVEPANISFHIAADKAVFAMQERIGNIWMTELPQGSR